MQSGREGVNYVEERGSMCVCEREIERVRLRVSLLKAYGREEILKKSK